MADCSSRSGFVSAAAFTTARTGCTLVGVGHVGAEDEGPESGIVQDARRIIWMDGWDIDRDYGIRKVKRLV